MQADLYETRIMKCTNNEFVILLNNLLAQIHSN